MKFQMYGGPKAGGWSGHMDYEPGVDPELAPCPFCGAKDEDVDCSNTHTPCANVECYVCGATGPMASNVGMWTRRLGKDKAAELFKSAFYEAIRLWNDRGGKS